MKFSANYFTAFNKTCNVCKQNFSSLVTFMSHIKNEHSKEEPSAFVKNSDEIKWKFREDII
jgi:hypothetical protein